MENLAAKGIDRITPSPNPDIEICKQYRPEDICKLGVVADAWGLETGALFIPGVFPDWLVSGYRDRPADATVRNSPHYFAAAFDVYMGTYNVLKQIQFVSLAVVKLGLFKRGGIYVGRNTCHIDTCDVEWQKKYGGAPFWVWHKGKYTGHTTLAGTSTHALSLSGAGPDAK